MIGRLCSETPSSKKLPRTPGSACSLYFSNLVLVVDGKDRTLPFLYGQDYHEEEGVMATERWDIRDRQRISSIALG